MQNIKAIIFDLGGVLLNIDFKKVSNAFKALGVDTFDEMYSQSEVNMLFENLEVGKINEEEFCNGINTHSGKSIIADNITTAWNSILLDFRTESLACLKNLKNRYKLFLLSNTNSIHLEAFNKIFEKSIGKGTFNSFFDKAYYSHEIGMRKPDASAYLYVLNENNLLPEETLFIDDTLKNIEGARAVGLQTIFLSDGKKIEDLNL